MQKSHPGPRISAIVNSSPEDRSAAYSVLRPTIEAGIYDRSLWTKFYIYVPPFKEQNKEIDLAFRFEYTLWIIKTNINFDTTWKNI